MSDKKLEALKGFLDRLPPREAAALARRLELQRTLGQETVPAESILASLRQQLRVAQPFRTPTLRLLAIADPLRQALEAVSTTAARLGQTRGRRILEFSDDTISEAKQQYLRFTDAHGTDARYVALGIMNRLERPWQILRLGRALSW